MYPFSQSVTPAAQQHIQAQLAFVNDLSRSLMQSAQQLSELQLQFAQSMFEDSCATGEALAGISRPTELLSVTAARAQPAATRLRAYQQQLSRIAADSQNKLIRVAGEHAEATTRAARELTDEVTRVTSEETERTLRSQHDAMRQLANPLDSIMDSATRQARAAMGDGLDAAASAGQATASAGQVAAAAARQQQPPRKEAQAS